MMTAFSLGGNGLSGAVLFSARDELHSTKSVAKNVQKTNVLQIIFPTPLNRCWLFFSDAVCDADKHPVMASTYHQQFLFCVSHSMLATYVRRRRRNINQIFFEANRESTFMCTPAWSLRTASRKKIATKWYNIALSSLLTNATWNWSYKLCCAQPRRSGGSMGKEQKPFKRLRSISIVMTKYAGEPSAEAFLSGVTRFPSKRDDLNSFVSINFLTEASTSFGNVFAPANESLWCSIAAIRKRSFCRGFKRRGDYML